MRENIEKQKGEKKREKTKGKFKKNTRKEKIEKKEEEEQTRKKLFIFLPPYWILITSTPLQ